MKLLTARPLPAPAAMPRPTWYCKTYDLMPCPLSLHAVCTHTVPRTCNRPAARPAAACRVTACLLLAPHSSPLLAGFVPIVVSWFFSPFACMIVACIFFFIVRTFLLRSKNPVQRVVWFFPVLIAVCLFINIFFILVKGAGKEIADHPLFGMPDPTSPGKRVVSDGACSSGTICDCSQINNNVTSSTGLMPNCSTMAPSAAFAAELSYVAIVAP